MNIRSISVIVAMALLSTPAMIANPEALEWKTIAQGLENAPKLKKLIVLDVYTDWCGWCKRMDRDTYADTNVVAYMNQRYIACKMNPEKKGSLTYDGKEYSLGEFAQSLGISGYPATAFFDSDGKLLTVVSGYFAPKDFLPVLKYFGTGAYLKGSFENYLKAQPGAQ